MAENISFPDQFRQAKSRVEGLLKKSFNKAEDASSNIANRTSGGSFRYPVDESYPVYMHYRVREVIPPLRNATDQVNELYQAHVDDELVPVRGQADALDFENNVQSLVRKFAIIAKMYLTACQTTFPPERKTKLRARKKSAAPAMNLAVGSATAVEKPSEDNMVNKKTSASIASELAKI